MQGLIDATEFLIRASSPISETALFLMGRDRPRGALRGAMRRIGQEAERSGCPPHGNPPSASPTLR
ncbi:hypothetical protein MTBSS4_300036 [Magnetospirillum sp. SS-4]|nr:hypothetical protein MTBSS4_300036 [Magnetospirillum sp. SS-4]